MEIDKKILNSLLILDFSANEIAVYSALLRLESSMVGALIKKTQLHRNIVYTALNHLVSRKLVSEKLVNGKKTFAIVSPLTLETEYQEKALVAKEVALEINRSIPKEVQEIAIHQGNDEYLQLLTSIIQQMPKGSTKYVIGTGGEDFMAVTMRPIWKKYHQVARTQGIKIRMLAYESQREAISKDTDKEGIYEVRYLPQNIENPAGLHVYPEIKTILNIIYSDQKNPVTAIYMKNGALVEGYLNLFNNLWEMGGV